MNKIDAVLEHLKNDCNLPVVIIDILYREALRATTVSKKLQPLETEWQMLMLAMLIEKCGQRQNEES